MKEFLIYEGKVAVVMAVFWLFFKLLLSTERLHKLNRIVLVGTVVVSFILPLCVITVHKPAQALKQIQTQMPSLEVQQAIQPELVSSESYIESAAPVQTTVEPVAIGIDWWSLAAFAYLIGIMVVLVKIAQDILMLRKKISTGERHDDTLGNSVIVLNEDIGPFSWMHYIFLSQVDYETSNELVMEHERAHIRLGHAKELLWIECMSAMQWFNPVMWLLMSDLKTIYEYEADDAVLSKGIDIKEYQYLLLRKAVSKSGYSFANSFNHSILKNRLTMMSKQKKTQKRGLRALYILPLLGGALMLNAETIYDRERNEKIVNVKEKGAKVEVKEEEGEVIYMLNGRKVSPDKLVDNVGSVLKLKKWKKEFESLRDMNKAELSIDESVDMSKVIDIHQMITDCSHMGACFSANDYTVKKIYEQHPELDESTKLPPFGVVESVEVVANNKKGKNQNALITDEEPMDFSKLTKKPGFNGGDLTEFSKWISSHVDYPESARAVGLQGCVQVYFKVNSDGRVSDVRAKGDNSISNILVEETAELICSSPKWTPGELNGKRVATTMFVPVYWRLQ